MKNPILSKTIQGILLVVLPHFLAKFGLKFDDASVQGWTEDILMLIGGAWGIYGRVKAEVPLKNPLAGTRLPGAGLLLLSTLILQLSTGCATVHQTATSRVAADGSEERSVDLRVTALGDAKQAIEKLNTQSGKTVSAGASGTQQESTSESLRNLIELLRLIGAAK